MSANCKPALVHSAVLRMCRGHAMFAYTLNILLRCKHSFYELKLAKANKIRKQLDLFLLSLLSSQPPFCFSARDVHAQMTSARRSVDINRYIYVPSGPIVFFTCVQHPCPALIPAQVVISCLATDYPRVSFGRRFSFLAFCPKQSLFL